MANVKTGSKLIPKLMKPDSNQVKYVESKQLKRQNKRIKDRVPNVGVMGRFEMEAAIA